MPRYEAHLQAILENNHNALMVLILVEKMLKAK